MKKIKICGDVHNNQDFYLKTIKNSEYSLQLGDMGFSYKWMEDAELDSNKHKFLGGNHENMDLYYDSPFSLGDYGGIPFIPDSFFVRGGFSIDVADRTPGISWWDKEELSWPNLESAYNSYCKIKPDYMFSHECPLSLVPKITDGRIAVAYGFPPVIETRTTITLERMFKEHQPKIWFFGHYHRDFDQIINGTRFICLCTDGRKIKNTHFDLEV